MAVCVDGGARRWRRASMAVHVDGGVRSADLQVGHQ
jgi:hypothetical protein